MDFAGFALLHTVPSALAEESHGHVTRGDAAILRFLAAAEIIESDLWLQYNELSGVQGRKSVRNRQSADSGIPLNTYRR